MKKENKIISFKELVDLWSKIGNIKKGIKIEQRKPYLVRLLLILFAPRRVSGGIHFVIEEIPIGWIIVGLSVLVNVIFKFIS